MNRKGYFSWGSSLMVIVSVEQRISKTTEKPYMVIKARMVFFGNMQSSPLKKQASKTYTMVCFKESLFELFEVDNWHTFEGELSFDWGNTWLKITRLYDDKGNRLLRPVGIENGNAADEKLVDSFGKNLDNLFTERIEENQEGNESFVCEHNCDECLDYDTSDCPLY
jgi:hypothetical protein